MQWGRGWFPMPRSAAPPTYTLLDGELRVTTWESGARRVRARIGGSPPVLGEGVIADELRALGLPKKPTLSITVADMRASFGPAQVIERQT